jgi:putative transcriptional regulator
MKRDRQVSLGGKSIIAGLQDALAYAQGDTTCGQAHTVCIPTTIDVKAIRQRLGLTQATFAQRYGFTLSSIRNWEQDRRQPEGAARVLLLVIDKEPEAVQRALAS